MQKICTIQVLVRKNSEKSFARKLMFYDVAQR